MQTKRKLIILICIALCLPWLQSIAKAEAAATTITISTDDLNVRSGPGLEYNVISTLAKGKVYSVLQEEGEWIQIQLTNDTKGWVANYLVTKNDKEESSITPEKKKEDSAKTGLITVNSLNFRVSPALDAAIIGKLDQGTIVEIRSERNDWVEIQFAGQIGWVSEDYVQFTEIEQKEHTESNNVELEATALTILHNGTNIRKNPNTQSTILERANKGDTFNVKGFANDWYEIQLTDGQVGYVASWVVKPQNEVVTEPISNEPANQDWAHYLKNKKIVIDPGHGGRDNGTTGTRGTLEKELTLETARNLYEKLKAAGADVTLTRQRDKYLNLPYRVNVAYEQNADAFISIHYDSSKDHSVRGLTTYYYYPWQKELAVNIHSALIEETDMKDRGSRFGDYYVIRENNKKAVLIELGYLSNPTEELHVQSNQYQESAATGIFEGLARYFKER
ncbi:N-acetylmuramoyl-L-alanine amidase [Bacillus tuaregi]|uniref:N-acetylmuramoyl-L-alanine amidase n=1 Tax=Bacillus tuaregi TaxID=1816695 RepID=UPI0008F83B84|nr:N-acetylmuramoyl-L-alanine amidase [Bacillus tuaregi]